jgi:hypothetical protein
MVPLKGGQMLDSIDVFRVGKPSLPTVSSFGEGYDHVDARTRTAKAKRDWVVTDAMTVQSYAFSRDVLHIHFDDATLEIRANGPTVSWDVRGGYSPPSSCANLSLLIHTQYDNRQELFDRHGVLRNIIGKHIRYAPDLTGLYLLWQPEQEIGIHSLPLVDQVGWLLHYG